jgi:hypothetical protein
MKQKTAAKAVMLSTLTPPLLRISVPQIAIIGRQRTMAINILLTKLRFVFKSTNSFLYIAFRKNNTTIKISNDKRSGITVKGAEKPNSGRIVLTKSPNVMSENILNAVDKTNPRAYGNLCSVKRGSMNKPGVSKRYIKANAWRTINQNGLSPPISTTRLKTGAATIKYDRAGGNEYLFITESSLILVFCIYLLMYCL